MKIVKLLGADTQVKRAVNMKAAMAQYDNMRERRGKMLETEEATRADAATYLRKIVNPQLKQGWRLDLSDDKAHAKKLRWTERHTRKIKETLSKRQILYVPDYGKQKGEGQYPLWLLRVSLATTTVVDSGKERTIRPVEERYNTYYCESIHYPAIAAIREQFDWEEQEYGVEVEIDSRTFWILVNIEISFRLEQLEMTRDDFRI